ncbi:MAG: putative L-rhamnose mutarotase [Chloroflexi bacterium]|nr:putative L-rhamnose mutarotase [Chloroflexota bacterium]
MQRIAFLLELKNDDPSVRAEYAARHDAIWPEMSALLSEAGMHNYSIFRCGTQLFAYCEVDDWEATLRHLNGSEVNARWQAHMADMLDTPIDPATGSFFILEEMFHHQ